MDKKPLILALAAVAVISVSACAMRATDRPPGKYESESTRVDQYGTKTTTKKTTDVEVDEHGNKKATVETESSRDPEGLFNKSTTKNKEVVREKGY